MTLTLLRIWDGFHIVAEGFGWTGRRADRFADVAWLSCAALLACWLAFMTAVATR